MSVNTPYGESYVTINQGIPPSSQSMAMGQQLPPALANVPKSIIAFYKGQPEALGAAQLFVGIMFFVLGVCITNSFIYPGTFGNIIVYSGVMFWFGITQIIAGSISVAAAAKPTLGLVRSSLVLNIFGSLFGAAAIILVSMSFPLFSFYSYNSKVCLLYPLEDKCHGVFNLQTFSFGLFGILLLFSTLMFCISISAAVYACMTACRTSFEEVTVVIYQTAPLSTDISDTKTFTSVSGTSEIQQGIQH